MLLYVLLGQKLMNALFFIIWAGTFWLFGTIYLNTFSEFFFLATSNLMANFYTFLGNFCLLNFG